MPRRKQVEITPKITGDVELRKHIPVQQAAAAPTHSQYERGQDKFIPQIGRANSPQIARKITGDYAPPPRKPVYLAVHSPLEYRDMMDLVEAPAEPAPMSEEAQREHAAMVEALKMELESTEVRCAPPFARAESCTPCR